jgi:hypothetical protein
MWYNTTTYGWVWLYGCARNAFGRTACYARQALYSNGRYVGVSNPFVLQFTGF